MFVRLCVHWDGEPTYQLFILCAAQSDTQESISPSFSPAGITGGAVMGHTTLVSRRISMLLLFWPGGISGCHNMVIDGRGWCCSWHRFYRGDPLLQYKEFLNPYDPWESEHMNNKKRTPARRCKLPRTCWTMGELCFRDPPLTMWFQFSSRVLLSQACRWKRFLKFLLRVSLKHIYHTLNRKYVIPESL